MIVLHRQWLCQICFLLFLFFFPLVIWIFSSSSCRFLFSSFFSFRETFNRRENDEPNKTTSTFVLLFCYLTQFFYRFRKPKFRNEETVFICWTGLPIIIIERESFASLWRCWKWSLSCTIKTIHFNYLNLNLIMYKRLSSHHRWGRTGDEGTNRFEYREVVAIHPRNERTNEKVSLF